MFLNERKHQRIVAVAILATMALEPSAYAGTKKRHAAGRQVETIYEAGGGQQKHYLKIGGNPVYPNRPIAEGEMVQAVSQDRWVVTIDRDGKISKGWIPAGTEVVTIATANPQFRKAVWIRKCGNPILNPEDSALFFQVAPQQQAQPVQPATAIPSMVQPVQQVAYAAPPAMQSAPVPVAYQQPAQQKTCRERKAEVSWWRRGLAYVVTAIGGVGGALIGGKVGGANGIKIGAGAGVFAGRLIGGYTDGSECIDAQDVTEGVLLGVTAGMIAPTNAPKASTSPPNGPSTPPPNGPSTPPNGPATLPPNGPAPLPSNGPGYFGGPAPIGPSAPVAPAPLGPAPVPFASSAPMLNGPAPLPTNGPAYFGSTASMSTPATLVASASVPATLSVPAAIPVASTPFGPAMMPGV